MSRKKKETRKYEPRNEFRYNLSPHAKGHPHYVFGKKGNKLKSLGLTTHPKAGIRHYELSRNPDQSDNRTSFLQLTKPHTAHEKYYSDPLNGWNFSSEDMPIVRHRIKQYKKSMNRKSLMWYEKKKRK